MYSVRDRYSEPLASGGFLAAGISPLFFLVFLYFFTLHADQLNLHISLFHFRLNNLLALALLTYFSVINRGLQLTRGFCLCVCFFILSVLSSGLFGADPYRCGFYVLFALFVVVNYGLLPFHWMQGVHAERFFRLYLLSFWFVGGYALIQLLLSAIGIYDPFCSQFAGSLVRPNAFTYEPSYYALTMSPFVAYMNTLYLTDTTKRRGGLPALLAANGLMLVSTSTGGVFSYGVYAVVVAGVACLGLVRATFPRIVRKIMLFYMGALFGVCLLLIFFPQFSKDHFFKFFYRGFAEHHSFFERWITIVNSWEVFLKHPWLGVGMGGIGPFILDAYEYGDAAVVLKPMHTQMLNYKTFDPENITLEVLASLGVFGALAFGALLRYFLKLHRSVLKANTIPIANRQQAFALFVSMFTMFGTMQFSQGILRTYVWVHFCISAGYMVRLIRESRSMSQ